MIAMQGANLSGITSYSACSNEESCISSIKSASSANLKQKTPLSDHTGSNNQDSGPSTNTLVLEHQSAVPERLSFQSVTHIAEDVNVAANRNGSSESIADSSAPLQIDDSTESLLGSQNEEAAFPTEECVHDSHMRRVVSEVDTTFQELFPLSPKPWKDRIATEGLVSVSNGAVMLLYMSIDWYNGDRHALLML